jgi:hypothetical protein
MTAMLTVIFLLAAAAWLVAVASALSLVGIAPSGGKFDTLMDLGWWRFGAIEARIGPSARTHIKRYRLAFMAFFLIVLVVAVAAIVLSPNSAASG